MAADTVKVHLSAHYDGKTPGDKVEVDAPTAKRLIAGGIAVPATVAAAKQVDVAPETAATKRD